jgi:hypothetical protein
VSAFKTPVSLLLQEPKTNTIKEATTTVVNFIKT